MPTTGATGYDSLSGAGYPSATLTDFSLYVQATMSASWQAAFAAAGADTGRIRVTDGSGTELPRDILSYSSGVLSMRVLWSGARGLDDYPALRVYPDATGSYSVTDTYGGQAAYGSCQAYFPLDGDGSNRTGGAAATVGAGAPAYMEGTLGQALVGASGNYLSVQDGATSDLAANHTIMVWCRPKVPPLNNWGGFLAKGTSYGIIASATDNTKLAVEYGTVKTFAVTNFWDGSWHHVAVVLSGTDLTVYKDGSPLGTTTATFVNNSDPLVIGTNRGNVTNGDVDDVQLHSVARSAEWIAYEYGITSNPTAFWNNSGWTSLATGSSIAAIAAYYRRMRG